ncbi:MAG: shikimate dehydrogenase [Vicinamibacterales bacterium]
MAHTRLCVTVAARTMADLRARRDALAGADLVELRLDTVDRPDVDGTLAGRRAPVIVTCRPAWEGGAFRGSEEERLGLLERALEAGAEFVDVEARALTPAFANGAHRARLVVSLHDFDGVPGDLDARVAAMSATGAGTVKVAVMAQRLSDCLRLLDLAERRGAPTSVIAMGEAGIATRVLAARFGSCWTYAAEDAAVAPGQLSARRMHDEFGFSRVGADTALYGVLGRPVSHSVSPAIHNAAFRALGLDAVYLPLAAESYEDFVAFADGMDLRGASVTAPFKVDAFNHAGTRDEQTRRSQAINTLRRRDGRWEGLNTDAAGFMAPLTRQGGVTGARVTILGAGGAARAVAVALGVAGASVTLCARRIEQAEAVARLTGARVAPWPPVPGSWDILVNATPVGTHPRVDESPLPAAALDGGLVYDLVYNPPRTRLMADAAARGCRTLGGLDMLVAQAQAQCAWWTGAHPPDRTMRDAALARLHEINHV